MFFLNICLILAIEQKVATGNILVLRNRWALCVNVTPWRYSPQRVSVTVCRIFGADLAEKRKCFLGIVRTAAHIPIMTAVEKAQALPVGGHVEVGQILNEADPQEAAYKKIVRDSTRKVKIMNDLVRKSRETEIRIFKTVKAHT